MKTRENFGKAQGAAITMDESQDRPISTNGGIDPYGLFDRSTSSVAPERAAVPQSDPSNFNYDYIDTIACVAIYDKLTSTPQILSLIHI